MSSAWAHQGSLSVFCGQVREVVEVLYEAGVNRNPESRWIIPKDWVWTKLSALGEIVGGGTPSTKEPAYWADEIGWISPADLTGYSAKIISKGLKSISRLGLENSSAKLMPAGSVHFSTRAPIGHVAISTEPIATNQGFKSLVPAPDIFNEYVYYYLMASRAYARNRGKGTTFLELSGRAFGELPIPLAPTTTQHKVVTKIEELFSELDKGIESLKAARAKLDVYRQAVLKHAFEGKLTAQWREENKDKLETPGQLLARIKQEREARYEQQLQEWKAAVKKWEEGGKPDKKPNRPKKVNDLPMLTEAELRNLPRLPDVWGWVRLGNLGVEVSDGPFGSNLKNSDYVGNGVRVIRLENIGVLEFHNEKVSFITPEKYKTISKHNVTAGDVIVSSFVANGIRAVVLPNYIERAINKADCFCIHCSGENPINRFIVMFLVTRCAHRQLGTQVHGATRPRINTTQLRNCAVPLVSLSEQELITLELEEKLALIEELETDIEACVQNAATLRQSILKRAFSGQLVPQDPNDEPASILLERIKNEKNARSQNNKRT